MHYVWNGNYVQHQGTKESCEQYVRNARSLFGVKGLTIVIKKNGKYVPAD
jgi:hypothetical protein